ncbi:VOC family protein [Cellulomonas sp. URHB0016]
MALVVSQLTIDSPYPERLARWWAEVLGWRFVWEPAPDDDEFEIAPADGSATSWLFVLVPDDKVVKNRLHCDLRPADGSDQASELSRLLSLGATPLDIGQGDVPWHVLADPEGNEFCLLHRTVSEAAAALAAELDSSPSAGS